MSNFPRIYLKDSMGRNIYIRFDPNFQQRLFSRFSASDFKLSATLFSQYKLGNIAFPLDLLLQIIRRAKIKEQDIYTYLIEIKHGQRSKPLIKPKLPIEKDPDYWNILFALFCDGGSDQWSSQHNRIRISPTYTSYSKEILDSFIRLVEHKFGAFKYKVFGGSVRIPPVIDVIFKSQHDINSFNTKSTRIPQFILTKKFKQELRDLSPSCKTAILIRYLVDEGGDILPTLKS